MAGTSGSEDTPAVRPMEPLTGPGAEGADPAVEEAGGETSPKRGRWRWVAAAVAVVAVGGGAWAYSMLSGGGQQPAEVFPASAAVYFRLDLDPSAGQKLAAVQLAERFPALDDVSDDLGQDLVEAVFDAAAEGDGEFAGRFSYEDDFAPWLGDRFGLAVVADDLEAPTTLVAVQVTDRDAAEEMLPELLAYIDESLGDGAGSAYRFVGDYAVLGPSEGQVERYVSEAEETPLSENDQFLALHESQGDLGIASFWMDLDLETLLAGDFTAVGDGIDAVPASHRLAADDGDDDGESEPGNLAGAGVVRLGSSHVEMVGSYVSEPGSVQPFPIGTEGSIDPEETLGRLPASTLFALAWGGSTVAEEQQAELWEQMVNSFGMPTYSPGDFEAEAEESLGVSLPEDLFALFSNDVTIVADRSLLDTLVEGAELAFEFDLAFRFESPDEEAAAAVEKLVGLVETFGLPLAVDQDGDTTVVALADGYLDRLTGDDQVPALAGSDRLERLLPSTDPVLGLFYFDVEGVVGSLDDLGAEVSEDVRDNLDPLQASIATVSVAVQEGDLPPVVHFGARLALSED